MTGTESGDASSQASADTPLALTVSEVGGCRVVHLSGELDVLTAALLRKKLDTVMAKDTRVVLDVRDLGFMDSSGLGVLVGAQKKTRSNPGAGLVIVCAGGPVLRLLSITGLLHVFTVVGTLESAMS